MARTRLAEMRAATRALERAEQRVDRARQDRDDAIRAAHAEGVTVPQIMAATELSRPMVYRVLGHRE